MSRRARTHDGHFFASGARVSVHCSGLASSTRRARAALALRSPAGATTTCRGYPRQPLPARCVHQRHASSEVIPHEACWPGPQPSASGSSSQCQQHAGFARRPAQPGACKLLPATPAQRINPVESIQRQHPNRRLPVSVSKARPLSFRRCIGLAARWAFALVNMGRTR